MKHYLKLISLAVFLSSNEALIASNAPMFSITPVSGSSTAVAIRLCLNGKGPISCQDYNTTRFTFSVRTLIANHTYPNAGIKILTPGYTLANTPEAQCAPSSNGYCIFPVSNTKPRILSLLAQSSTQISVNLSSLFTDFSQTEDGVPFNCLNSLDGATSYSQNLLGTSLNFNGTTMTLGLNNSNTTFNGIKANNYSFPNTAILLPQGHFTKLNFLGAGVNGDQPGQQFTITYTDNTTTSSLIDLSDWASASYPAQTLVKNMPYRNICHDGSQDPGSFNIYGYTITLDPTKTVKNIILPNNNDVIILSMSLI